MIKLPIKRRILHSIVILIIPLLSMWYCHPWMSLLEVEGKWQEYRIHSDSLAAASSTGWMDSPKIFVPFRVGETEDFQLSRNEFFASLQELTDRPATATIQIIGLPDKESLSPEQAALSQRRAETIKNTLIKEGFDPTRLVLTTFGEAPRVVETPKVGGVTLTVSASQQKTLAYYWNIWPEEAGRRFQPISILRPSEKYVVKVDLSGVAYELPGIQTFLVEKKFRDLVEKKITEGEETLQLDVVLLTDRRFFKTASNIVEKLEINLAKVRAFEHSPNRFSKELAELLATQTDLPFVFDRLRFEVEKTEQLGWGSIGLSFWHEGRPYDEISMSFCIQSRNQMCPDKTREANITLGGSELFEVNNNVKTQRPDAALHLIEFSDSLVAGVFTRNDHEIASKLKHYSVWTVSHDANALRTSMDEIQHNFGLSREDPVSVGRSLLNLIFPPRNPEAQNALNALISFYREHNAGDAFLPDRPTLFVRSIRQSSGETSLYPIGILNIDGTPQGFIGYHVQIHTPLPEQDYSLQSCPRSWQVVLPVQTPDSALGDAREQLVKRFKINPFDQNKSRYTVGTGSAPIFSQFEHFNRWIDPRDFRDAVTLMVVSHHNRNSLYFDTNVSILHSNNVSVTFRAPSIAILAGCSTGQPGAGSIAYTLNQAGVQSILATNTGVSGALAGDFVEIFTRQVENTTTRLPIGRLFAQVQRALYELRNNAYGASVLSFSLAGNQALEVCQP